MLDVCIIGAGIAGCACARELAAYDLDVMVVEAGYDVSCGTTRANSGIVHAGYDPQPGTLKARYNVLGSRLYPQLAQELGFSYSQCGSMVVAFSDEERPALEQLLKRGNANGVEGLRIIEDPELHQREPNLSPAAVAALWVPTGGIVDPYGACLAFAENAATNGVAFRFNTYVESVRPLEDGTWELSLSDLLAQDANASGKQPASADRIVGQQLTPTDTMQARIVINAAGLESGRLNNQVSPHRIKITPRAGEYLLLDKAWGGAFTSTIFQVPTKAGKGVLVTPTTGGNILIGPDTIARDTARELQTTGEGLAGVLEHARRTWEHIPAQDAITNFAGLRSSCLEEPDFHLGEALDAPGFYNIAGFDSPGLTSAPAVAQEYAARIADQLHAQKRPDFNPHRPAPLFFSQLTDEERARLAEKDPAWGRLICRCELVTEAQILAALRSPLPATTTDAVKWRTRAGMGRCQAGFCLPLVAELIARETGCEPWQVRKGWPGSELAVGLRGCLTDLPEVSMGEEAAR